MIVTINNHIEGLRALITKVHVFDPSAPPFKLFLKMIFYFIVQLIDKK